MCTKHNSSKGQKDFFVWWQSKGWKFNQIAHEARVVGLRLVYQSKDGEASPDLLSVLEEALGCLPSNSHRKAVLSL